MISTKKQIYLITIKILYLVYVAVANSMGFLKNTVVYFVSNKGFFNTTNPLKTNHQSWNAVYENCIK